MLQLTNYTIEALERRLFLSAPDVPDPFLFMSGYSDSAKFDFQKIMPYYTAIGGLTSDAALVKQLRSEGKLFLHQTVADPSRSVAQLVSDWSAPFRNELGGALPGGFDAIQIDEFGAWANGSPESVRLVSALQQLRQQYPDKRIFVWSVWQVADGGPNSIFGNPAVSYSHLLQALNNHADRYMLELYINERNPQIHLFEPFAQNIESFAPGIREKTVFGLYIPQSGFVADDSANVGFWGYLDAQLHTIRNNPATQMMRGAAFWIWYRSERLTGDYVGRLVDHYFVQNQTSWFGDGSYTQLIGNPQFENNTNGWTLTPGAGGSISRFNYSTEGVQNYHDTFGHATHFNWGLKMVRGTSPSSASYSLNVAPGMTYTASAFVLAGAGGSADRARLAVTTADGLPIAAREVRDAPASIIEGPWRRIIYHFAVPSDVTSVKLVLSDETVAAGTRLYWDFIEAEQAFATDVTAPVLSDAWFEFDQRQALALRFSENVAPSLTTTDLQLLNLTTSQTISAGAMALAYPGGTAPAIVTFPGLSGGVLPDGDYRLTVPAGSVSDLAGNQLANDFTIDFFVLAGDANRDRRVDLLDFNLLAANFGRSGRTFSQGNFNYDDAVDLTDFNIIASRFGSILLTATAQFSAGTLAGGIAPDSAEANRDAELEELL